MEKDLRLSKNLYNAALFRIRQVFTGWDKEERTENEEEVFREVRTMQAAYPKVKVRRVLSYRALDAVMRANRNPDFYGKALYAEIPEGRQAHILYHEPGCGPVPCVQGDGCSRQAGHRRDGPGEI